MVTKNIHIVAPSSLKQQVGLKVYGAKPFLLGKSGKILKKTPVCVNNEGIPAAKFDKFQMMQALLDSTFNHPYKDWLIANKEELMALKKLPSPTSDLTDAIFLSLLP